MEFNSLLTWKTEGLRFSFFTITAGIDHSKWWEAFTGNIPESTSSKPAMGEFVTGGTYGKGILELRILPDRVDWVYGTNILNAQDESIDGIFNIELTNLLVGLRSWLKEFPGKYTRLAFGTTLLNEVPEQRVGYLQLSEFLPFMHISSDSWQDFYFQFNKPVMIKRRSGDEISLNRLINYSVIHMQMMNFSSGILMPIKKYYSRIDFDINTSAETIVQFDNEDFIQELDILTDIVGAARSVTEV